VGHDVNNRPIGVQNTVQTVINNVDIRTILTMLRCTRIWMW